MKNIMALIACIGLALTAIPAFLVFFNIIELQAHKQFMLTGTMLWFVAAPVWFRKARESNAK